MHAKKLNNLLSMVPEERLKYFIRSCADFEEVWGLIVGGDNWVIFRDRDGDEVFPVWPHRELAEFCCFEEHKNIMAAPRSIPLKRFLEEFVPEMNSQNVYFGVFYDVNREGIAINAESLGKALQEEVESIWE